MSAVGNRKQQKHLAEALKRLRVLSGISQRELASMIELDQSTVSRIERGEQQRVSVAQAAAWCKATGAPDDLQADVLALTESILIGPTSWETASETGSTDFALEIAELEARTALLSNYRPATVPGLLQTPAYARRLLASGPAGPPAGLAERVIGRIDRQHILYDDAKHFRFIIPEAVLRWPYGPPRDPAVPDEHHEQLARIQWATRRPNIDIGILPLAPVAAWRSTGFVIFDQIDGGQPQVHLEWLTRPYNIFEPDQVDMCRRAFSNLMAEAATGDEARTLITAAAADLGSGLSHDLAKDRPPPVAPATG
jgi:transcriptional regulator with XRE-family HTH domain